MRHLVPVPTASLILPKPAPILSTSLTAVRGTDVMLSSVRPRVLVADDEQVIADTLALILNQSGYEACAVYGGREAVLRAERWSPEVFVSDVSMPEVNGIQAAIEICAMLPKCGVLMLSGELGSRSAVQSILFLGYRFQFVYKPILPAELLRHIRQLRAA
jgi:CheY-like chemotaxis protein